MPEKGWQSYQDLFQSDTLELIPISTLMERAFTMAVSIQHSLYDCLYLATAERLHSVAVTADRKFFDRVVQHGEYSASIRWVENPPEIPA